MKKLEDFTPSYSCRFHPTDSFHEVGCSHCEWTKEELQSALDASKQSQAYLQHPLVIGTRKEGS